MGFIFSSAWEIYLPNESQVLKDVSNLGIPLNFSAVLKVSVKSSHYSKSKMKTCSEVSINFPIYVVINICISGRNVTANQNYLTHKSRG